MHRHRQGQLIYPSAGVLGVTTQLGTWVAAADQVAWTPPGFAHAHRAAARTEIAALRVPGSAAASLPDRPAVFGVTPLLREAILVHAADPSAARRRRPGAENRLLDVIIDELLDAPERQLYLPEPRDDRLRAVAAALHRDVSDARTLAEHGRAVGASERTLSRLFKEELGMSFHQWRTQFRIQHALVLLWQGLTVSQTAAACGWANPSSFVDAFRTIVGETPGRYRSAQRPDSVTEV
ncbi:helix-turn-helix domain-containing protein [Curtobacterium sp. VKM Ac-2887]|nr:helix-turn-helix domain-containing protein [Curtobacterium sp. VKM Ac-2887]